MDSLADKPKLRQKRLPDPPPQRSKPKQSIEQQIQLHPVTIHQTHLHPGTTQQTHLHEIRKPPISPHQPLRSPISPTLEKPNPHLHESRKSHPERESRGGPQQRGRQRSVDPQPTGQSSQPDRYQWKTSHFIYPTTSLCISCTANFQNLRKTQAIERITKENYGPNIFVLGCTLKHIREFWKFIGYEAIGTIEEPQVVAKSKVDASSKCHHNYSHAGQNTLNDSIEIKSKEEDEKAKSKAECDFKSVTLQAPKMHGFHIGGSTGICADPGFFNLAEGAGIAAEDGINSSMGFHQVDNNTSLSQKYSTMEVLKVPPGRKVKAEITTWAVTYEAKTITKFTVDAHATLRVQYRSLISRLIGGCYISTGYLTAMDIFADEDNFKLDPLHNTVTFTRVSKISYLGEEVDIKKYDLKLPTNMDDI